MNARELNISPAHRSTTKMRFHIRTCSAYLQQGGMADPRGTAHLRSAGEPPPPDGEEDEDEDADVKHKFLHASDEELQAGFIFEHLTRNPRFDNVTRRPGY